MGDQQHGPPVQQLCRELLHRGAGARIQRREWLVQKDYRAILQQGPRQRCPLPHAARQGGGFLMGMILQTDPRKHGGGTVPVRRGPTQPVADHDVVDHRKPR